MNIIIDLSIIAIIAIFTLWGYYRGLIKVAFKILTFFIAIIVTLVLYKPVSNIVIEKTQIDENIENAIVEKFSAPEDEEIKDEDMQNISNLIEKYVGEYKNDIQNKTVKTLANQIAILGINIGVAISIFILAKIILILFKAFSEVLAELPVIKQFDKSGGTIYGLAEGLLIVIVILTIISITAPLFANLEIIKGINESIVGKFLYENNIILKIFKI